MRLWLFNLISPVWIRWKAFVLWLKELPLLRKPRQRQIELLLWGNYLWRNPYTLSRRFYEELGEECIHRYGETPLTTWNKILKEFELSSSDRLFELGAGRGRIAFFTAIEVDCEVVAYEQNPLFTKIARAIQEKVGVPKITIEEEDFLVAPFSKATAVYFYGLMESEERLRELALQLSQLPKGAKVISVGVPLSIYTKRLLFVPWKVVEGNFLWGTTLIHCERRI